MPTLKDIAKILVQKHELKQRDADLFVNAFVDTILEGLKTDRQVKIKGFGTFKVTSVRDRESVNVNTGERVIISGHDKISFTPDAVMRDIVNKPFAQFETVILADGVSFEDIPDTPETEEEETPAPAPAAPLKEEEEQEAPAPAAPTIKEEKQEAPAPAAPIIKEEEQKALAPAAPIIKEEEQKAQAPAAPLIKEEEEQKAPAPAAPLIEEEEEEEDPQQPDSKSDCKNIFILYAIVANIIIAAIAFVLGYLCATNNWLGLDRRANEELSSIEYIEEDSAKQAKATTTPTDSIKNQQTQKAESAEAKEAKEQEAKASDANTAQQKEQPKAETKTETPAAQPKAPTAEKKPEQPKPQQTAVAGKYDSDPRVRTGAYTIVGTANTVKVRAGQTLKSISKSYLGEGMECYVEVYNGGITQVSEGQTIKIPKLELKKKKK